MKWENIFRSKETIKTELKNAISGHWDIMEENILLHSSRSDLTNKSHARITDLARSMRDRQTNAFLDGDNYANTDLKSPTFGLAGLPVIIFLSQKYEIPIDQDRLSKLQEEQRVLQRRAAGPRNNATE